VIVSGLRRAVACVLLLAVAGCHRLPRTAPERATDTIAVPPQVSTIAVPVSATLANLQRELDKVVPVTLWAIDKPDQVCAAPAKVKVLFAKVTTPTIRCHLVGTVTRGPIRISGAGRDLLVTLPLHATIAARDIGGLLKKKTAFADATVHARIRLDVASDWSLKGAVAIAYDWTDAPHVDILGQRVEFTSKADEKLNGVIANLRASLPQQLAKLRFRVKAQAAWSAAFTSLKLNDADPTVWMRITPQALSYGGYAIEKGVVTMRLGMQARTESFVGPRPADPVATLLPPLSKLDRPAGAVHFAIPVIADYAELEPVVAKALVKRSQRPFLVPGIGPVIASFGAVRIYGTPGGKIAVGVTFTATTPGRSPSHGTIWLTARPVNSVDSRRVDFAELSVVGVTDSTGASLLIKLANAPGLSETVASSLTQDFSRDYQNLLGKIGSAISEKRQGDLVIRAHVDRIRTGVITAAGQGVYLPVSGTGTASIALKR
jgi:hypothetical protein